MHLSDNELERKGEISIYESASLQLPNFVDDPGEQLQRASPDQAGVALLCRVDVRVPPGVAGRISTGADGVIMRTCEP